VLLADDDEEEARQIQDLLKETASPRFEVLVTDDVQSAQESIRSQQIDILLLSLAIPQGDELASIARAKIGSASIPVLVITDDDDTDKTLRAVKEGAQDYLVKSQFDRRLLVRSIRHAVERHRLAEDLSRARQREHYAATHDRLTGLANRHALHDHLAQAIAYADRYGMRLAVLLVDLDRFKAINDTLGHSAGDRILRGIAERLSTATRQGDLVARVGGDEFLVVITNPEREQDPAKVAVRLLHSLTDPLSIESTQYLITGSIGIAVYPTDGHNPQQLMQAADLAAYHAKELGRGQYHFYSEDMNAAARLRLDLERGLRKAIDQNQLFVVFQPQVDVTRGRVIGAEALVRWQHPAQGVIGPDHWIPVAEEAGLIQQIGEWVLRDACSRAQSWVAKDGTPLRIAVNVSARQLTDERFPDRVAVILHEANLDPERLELEITEHTLMHHTGAAMIAFSRLREMGVRMSIDDFGTGYSSLSGLRHLPVSALKIDRSFVRDITTSPSDAKITAAAVAMAKGLGLQTVAEGVETREQLEFLHGLGVDLMQGYLFAKPLLPDRFEAWVQRPTARLPHTKPAPQEPAPPASDSAPDSDETPSSQE
jgi:diguanylate cyclase (GGDEF)-like protein